MGGHKEFKILFSFIPFFKLIKSTKKTCNFLVCAEYIGGQKIVNRPGVAGAVLQTPSSLLHLIIRGGCKKAIESLIMVTPPLAPPTVSDLGYFLACIKKNIFGMLGTL